MNLDESALDVFRSYRVASGQILCFHGPHLEKYRDSLGYCTKAGLISKERFAGAYSLTAAGFRTMLERAAND